MIINDIQFYHNSSHLFSCVLMIVGSQPRKKKRRRGADGDLPLSRAMAMLKATLPTLQEYPSEVQVKGVNFGGDGYPPVIKHGWNISNGNCHRKIKELIAGFSSHGADYQRLVQESKKVGSIGNNESQ